MVVWQNNNFVLSLTPSHHQNSYMKRPLTCPAVLWLAVLRGPFKTPRDPFYIMPCNFIEMRIHRAVEKKCALARQVSEGNIELFSITLSHY